MATDRPMTDGYDRHLGLRAGTTAATVALAEAFRPEGETRPIGYGVEEAASQTVIHFQNRQGWRKLVKMEGDPYQGRHTLTVPEREPPVAQNAYPNMVADDRIVARDFQLVKESIMIHHRNGGRIRELWFEER